MKVMSKIILLLFLSLPAWNLEASAASLSGSLALGRQYYSSGQYELAYDHFFTLFKDNPGDTEINFLLGRSALAKRDYEAAVMAFERVLLIAPAETAVKVELGKAFFYLGDIETAQQYFREALQGELAADVRGNLQEFLAGIK